MIRLFYRTTPYLFHGSRQSLATKCIVVVCARYSLITEPGKCYLKKLKPDKQPAIWSGYVVHNETTFQVAILRNA